MAVREDDLRCEGREGPNVAADELERQRRVSKINLSYRIKTRTIYEQARQEAAAARTLPYVGDGCP